MDRDIAFVNEAFYLIRDIRKYADETGNPLSEALLERADHFECYYADWVKGLPQPEMAESEVYEVGSAVHEYLPPYPLSVQQYPLFERLRVPDTGNVYDWKPLDALFGENYARKHGKTP